MIDRVLMIFSSSRRTIFATFLFTTLTIVMTWPLTAQISNSVIGWVGDNFYFVWLVGWFQKSLFVLHRLPMSVPFLNYPEGWNIAYNEMTPAMVLIALPASLIGGPTLGYNFSIMLSFVLSGLGVYLWVHRLTNNTGAGLVAGTIFAFAPYRMSHLLGHFNLMGTQWFPFYFLSLNELVDTPHRSRKSIALAALFLGLIGLTSQYYLYMTLIITVIYLIGYWLFVDRKLPLRLKFWKQLSMFVIVSLPIVMLTVMPYLQLASQQNLLPRTFEEVRIWSASPTDFLLPSPKHFMFGEWVARNFDRKLWIENTLYLGVVALALAVLALIKRKQVHLGNNQIVKVLVFTGLFAFLLALGTDFHWLGQSVKVPVPQLLQRWYPYPQTSIPLPGYFLFKYLPFYAGMRVWMRYGIFVSLFVSVLAGIGATWLSGRFNRRLTNVVLAIVLLLVFVDFYPGVQPLSQVGGRSVDKWLASQSGQEAVVQFPFWQVTQPQQTYYTLVHNKPFVGGFFAAFSTPQFQRIQPILNSFPDNSSVEILHELGVRWIIVDSTQYKNFGQIQGAIESLDLHLAGIFDIQYVYELR
jgi:hypothetical protein